MSLLPQFGFVELIVVAMVALIVIGPKDLPKLMRSLGQFVAGAKRMANEFTHAFEEMANEAEMQELQKDMNALRFKDMANEMADEVEQAMKPVSDEVNDAIKAGQEEAGKSSAELRQQDH